MQGFSTRAKPYSSKHKVIQGSVVATRKVQCIFVTWFSKVCSVRKTALSAQFAHVKCNTPMCHLSRILLLCHLSIFLPNSKMHLIQSWVPNWEGGLRSTLVERFHPEWRHYEWGGSVAFSTILYPQHYTKCPFSAGWTDRRRNVMWPSVPRTMDRAAES